MHGAGGCISRDGRIFAKFSISHSDYGAVAVMTPPDTCMWEWIWNLKIEKYRRRIESDIERRGTKRTSRRALKTSNMDVERSHFESSWYRHVNFQGHHARWKIVDGQGIKMVGRQYDIRISDVDHIAMVAKNHGRDLMASCKIGSASSHWATIP